MEEIHQHCKTDYVKVQSKFLKFTLGVAKTSSTSACLRELGQYPIFIKAYSQCLTYFHRLEKSQIAGDNVLIAAAHKEMKVNKQQWVESMQYILTRNWLGNVYYNINKYTVQHVKGMVTDRLRVIYKQENASMIAEKDHLNVLHECVKNKDFSQSKYLKVIKSPTIRSTFTKIRINASKFSKNPYTKISTLLVCDHCNEREDVKHVLLNCPKYLNERKEYIECIDKHVKSFKNKSDNNKLIKMLNLDVGEYDEIITNELVCKTASFVCKTYQKHVNN